MSDDLTLLSKFLGMMGSQHDGEVLNAARMAEKLRVKMNKSWGQLVTGQSSSGFDGEMRMMRRAVNAEMRVAELSRRVSELEATIRSMGTARPDAPRPSSSRRPRRGHDKYALPPEKEADLIRELTSRWMYSDSIYAYTNWPRAHLRIVLQRLADRRGYVLMVENARFGHGLRYRFEKRV